MPHKHNADRRHHIPKMSFKVQNWPAYEAGLRRRGSLTLWIGDAALECWQTIGPSGQARYREAAIRTSLMLRTAFKLALRQTEGLMTSVLTLMGLTLSAPDHTTVSRRAVTLPVIQPAQVPHGPLHVLIDSTGLQVYGAGQWLEAKHAAKSRRTWRKLHLAVDAASGMIVAQTLTDQDVDDPSQVGSLLDQIDDPVVQVTADGAYDGAPTYQTIAQHGDGIEVVIPPRATAIPSGELDTPTQRDRHLAMIAEQGRLAWQASTGYGQRSLVGTTVGRYKTLDRTAAASPRLCSTTVRICHRCGGAKPDVGRRTPGFCPSPARHRTTARVWGHLGPPSGSAPTPRDMAAAKAFFQSAKTVTEVTPDRATTDGHDSYPRAIRTTLGEGVKHRTSRYLNNRLEQDHRGIKGRYQPMRGFKCPRSAERFCRGYNELRNLLRPRSRPHQHISANTRRLHFLRRTATVMSLLQAA